MIESFDDEALQWLYTEGPSARTKRIPSDIHSVIRRKLDMLNAAHHIDDLRAPPANRLQALTGTLKGWLSICVNDQWRIVFRWSNNSASCVSLKDYH